MLPDGGQLLPAEPLGFPCSVHAHCIQLIPGWEIKEVVNDQRLPPGGCSAFAELLDCQRLRGVQWEGFPVEEAALCCSLDLQDELGQLWGQLGGIHVELEWLFLQEKKPNLPVSRNGRDKEWLMSTRGLLIELASSSSSSSPYWN